MHLLAKTIADIHRRAAAEVQALTDRAEDVHSIEGIMTGLRAAGVEVSAHVHAIGGELVATALIDGRDYDTTERALLAAGLRLGRPAGPNIIFTGEANGRTFSLGVGCLQCACARVDA